MDKWFIQPASSTPSGCNVNSNSAGLSDQNLSLALGQESATSGQLI